MVAPKWGRITYSHLLKLHLENSTGFLVGEIASLDYSPACLRGRLVTHSITRGQLSIARCVLLTLRLVSLILPSALHCIFRGLLRLTVKVRWAYKSYIY